MQISNKTVYSVNPILRILHNTCLSNWKQKKFQACTRWPVFKYFPIPKLLALTWIQSPLNCSITSSNRGTVTVPVYPRGVKWGWVHDSLSLIPVLVFPLQLWQRKSLWTSHCTQGHCYSWRDLSFLVPVKKSLNDTPYRDVKDKLCASNVMVRCLHTIGNVLYFKYIAGTLFLCDFKRNEWVGSRFRFLLMLIVMAKWKEEK